MKATITVQAQPRLGFWRTCTLTLHGIRYRLFRSLVTMTVIAVAVAFLMNTLGESLVRRSVSRSIGARLAERQQAAHWVARLSTAGDRAELLASLAHATPDSPTGAELAAMGFPAAETETLIARARRCQRLALWFDALDYSQRRQLVGQAEGLEALMALGRPEIWQQFAEGLAAQRSLRPPASLEVLHQAVGEWPSLAARLDAWRQRREAGLVKVAAARAGRPLLVCLAEPVGGFWQTVTQAGFAATPETVRAVSAQAQDMLAVRALEEALFDPALQLRQALAARRDILPNEVKAAVLWDELSAPEGAAWFLRELHTRLEANAGVRARFASLGYHPEALDAAKLGRLAEQVQTEARLLNAAKRSNFTGSGWLGLSERLSWLILVSLIVCTVGIANAMLMAVTERFREIATLKCLGALDGFIMLLFVLEACLLGLVGGLGGAAGGVLLATLRMWFSYGPLLRGALPLSELLAAMLFSALAGVLLAAVAAVYPSMKAARLAPMEAMRIE